MGKHRDWTIAGFDITSDKTHNLNVQMSNLPTYRELKTRTSIKAAELLMRDAVIGKMLPADASLVHYYGVVTLRASDYSELRGIRKQLISLVKSWAAKSRLSAKRGFRSYALKDVVIEKNDNHYQLKFDVIFSNCSFYDTNKNLLVVHNQEESDATTNHAQVLSSMLKGLTHRVEQVTLKAIV